MSASSDFPSNLAGAASVRSSDTRVSVVPDELNQALLEFDLMLRYVLSEGLALDDQTQKAVIGVQQLLLASEKVSVSVSQPSVVVPPEPSFPVSPTGPTVAPPEPAFAELLMTAHAALAKLIAPATPLSLSATEPGRRFGYLSNPPLIRWMIFIALFSVVGFLITSIVLNNSKPLAAAANASIATSVVLSPTEQAILERLNWLFSAALGAVFYVLFTALGYVKDRTYDPRYNSIYVIRFVLGVLAGLILAIVLQNSFGADTVSKLGPSVIALLGGFSTEAVYQVLQRLVEVLLAAIRGDNSGTAQAKAAGNAREELLKLADDPATPIALKSKVLAAARKVGS